LSAIDDLDWTESVKLAQKNWIGKSVGAEVTFAIKDFDESITVFTVAHDTMYGTTFLVLAPEHEFVSKITSKAQKAAVDAYIRESERKSEVERQTEKTKTGVFTGAYAINPLNNKTVPIWIADYVLVGYGTGAVMGVPGEDERDYEFAKKFDLEIIYTSKQQEFIEYSDIKKAPQKFTLANSAEFDGLSFKDGRQKILDKLVTQGVGKEKVNYKMRDWSVSRQRYWGAPIPIVNCPKCGAVLVEDDALPVLLPELTDYEPSGDGRSALARASDWLHTDCPKCGGNAERETDTLDTYIDSSWYMYRYFDPHNQQAIFDSELVKKWEPIDFYNGADHATAHLLYARFMARFFKRLGLVNDAEPFKQFLFNGKVTAADGQMFSKSKGNGIDPLEIIKSGYGADALRTYLMFAAPLDLWVRWDPQGVPGSFRFLNRLWNLTQEFLATKPAASKAASDAATAKLRQATHAMIKKVTEDIETNHYNTAIATMMGCVNELYKLKADNFSDREGWQQALENMVSCVAPFAPHIAEELWQQLGHSSSVHHDSWPTYNEQYLLSDTVTIVVQINGKLRSEVQVAASATEQQIITAAQADKKVVSYLDKAAIKKTVYIKGRLINFVV
jgi:leucyl-tRNA synthetase